MSEVVKVKRDGPRGWHWIARAHYDPARHELYNEACRTPADPFDHDGDGHPGGSLKGELSTVAKGRRKKKESGQ